MLLPADSAPSSDFALKRPVLIKGGRGWGHQSSTGKQLAPDLAVRNWPTHVTCTSRNAR